jgi:hypothetical protein
VAMAQARALGGLPVKRVLADLAVTRGLPQVLRTDNSLEFCGRAILTWAHARGMDPAADRAGQAHVERVYRIVPWPLPTRVPH